MKILTFVIPAYNSEKYLDKCLTSMLKPELLDEIEIIVVNDGSKDRTPEIAATYCEKYPDTVRLTNQENKGHGGALNAGCAAATGKYLKVIDADDWVDTESLPSFIQQLSMCESEVVLTLYHTINISTGEVRSWRCFSREFGKPITFGDVLKDWKAFDRSLTFHGVTYHTDCYQAYNESLPEHIFYEDHVFATFPCCLAKSIMPLDIFIYEYRIGDVDQSVSRVNQVKRHEQTENVLKIMEERYHAMEDSDGRSYVALKIVALLMSYFSIVLLSDPDRKEGRALAAEQYRQCAALAPDVADSIKRKYHIFVLMNRLHFTNDTWERILRSPLYNKMRGNHSFD